MEFTKCCGCLNLKTGSLVIGYLHLVLGFCELASIATYFGIGIRHLSVLNSPEWVEVVPVCLLGFHAVLTILSIGFTIGLIYGLHKNVHTYIHSYLVYNTIFLIFHVFDFFFFFMFRSNSNDVVVDLLSIFLTAYFLLVIKSYGTELKNQGAVTTTQGSVQTSPPAYPTVPGYPAPPAYSTVAAYPAVTAYPTIAAYPTSPAYPTEPVIYSESKEKLPIY